MADFLIRPATPADGVFLADMVVEAANWRLDAHRSKSIVLADPVSRGYIAGWQRPADKGVVAVDADGSAVGAAWFRLFSPGQGARGFVATGVPELIIGVRPLWRAQGVGRSLMRSLADVARSAGYARLALSVEHGNFAHALYRSEGFTVIETAGGRDTMVRPLR